jgi:hypothetical protein
MNAGDTIACSKCGEETPLTEYMIRAQTRICPTCQSRAATAWAKDNRQRKRASNNAYHGRISSCRAEATARYRENHPDRRAAHQAIQTAVRNGSLKRERCSVCGNLKAHAHHDDYSKPLDVIWLCHKHHMERHAMLKAREGGTP